MDLTQLKLSTKIDTSGILETGLNNINGITGFTSNTISSIQALIYPTATEGYNEDKDITQSGIVGISAVKGNNQYTGFIFDLKEDYSLTLTSDITDHFTEDNSAIQDHIALKPIIVEVSGKVAEKNLLTPYDEQAETDGFKKLLNKVDSISGRLGSLTNLAPNIFNQARDILNTAKSVYDTYKTFDNFVKAKKEDKSLKQTRQSKIVTMFKEYWQQRQVFVIVTPFCILNNMYIMDFVATQPRNTKYITDIKIKFKQIKVARTIKKYNTQKANETVKIQEEKNVINKPENIEPIKSEQSNLDDVAVLAGEETDKNQNTKTSVNISSGTITTSDINNISLKAVSSSEKIAFLLENNNRRPTIDSINKIITNTEFFSPLKGGFLK